MKVGQMSGVGVGRLACKNVCALVPGDDYTAVKCTRRSNNTTVSVIVMT